MADSSQTASIESDTVAGEAAPAVRAATATGPTPAVELDGIARRLGDRWALRGVTLRVGAGEVAAVVGPNGSGKTTLLRVLATTLAPTRGAGRVFGYDLAAAPDAVRAVAGMLGHGTGLYDDLSAAENLAFSLRMCGASPAQSAVEATLDAVGLGGLARTPVRRFSAGMRRRVALARLMLRRPRLLLLDEPYNSLDADGVALVDRLVRDTVRVGGSAIVVTHDLAGTGLADRGYDRVLAMSGGRIRAAPPAPAAVRA